MAMECAVIILICVHRLKAIVAAELAMKGMLIQMIVLWRHEIGSLSALLVFLKGIHRQSSVDSPLHVKIQQSIAFVFLCEQTIPLAVIWQASWRLLTHWGRVTHICVGKLTIIDSDNGLSPGRRQAIIWTNPEILLIRPLRINFGEILKGIQIFHSRKCTWKCRLPNGVHLFRPQCVKVRQGNGQWPLQTMGSSHRSRELIINCDYEITKLYPDQPLTNW